MTADGVKCAHVAPGRASPPRYFRPPQPGAAIFVPVSEPTPVVFWGATGQAKVLRTCLDERAFRLVALFDNEERPSPFADVEVYRGRAGFQGWRAAHAGPVAGWVAIGGSRGATR